MCVSAEKREENVKATTNRTVDVGIGLAKIIDAIVTQQDACRANAHANSGAETSRQPSSAHLKEQQQHDDDS